MLNNSEIEKKLKEAGIVKAVIGDYVIYKRDWLYDHIEQERTLINSVKDFRDSKPQIMDGITRLKQFIAESEKGGQKVKKEELDKYCGYIVDIILYDGCVACGELEFIPRYSAKYDFKHPGFYYIGNMSFKSTEVKKIKIVEAKSEDKECQIIRNT